MKPLIPIRGAILCFVSILLPQFASAHDFEGRIAATFTHGPGVETLVYTFGTNCLRIERGESNQPYPKNLVAADTGAITLLFPNNRSFVRLKPRDPNAPDAPPGFPVSGATGRPMQPSPSRA